MNARLEVRERVRGLYGLADADAADGDPERLVVALLAGGCRLVQLRCKGWSTEEIERVARPVSARCAAVGATFLVNDHAEVAAAVDAHGVHVGQLDDSPEAVRRALGPDRILGRSTHDPDQLMHALDHADYVAFGPVFDTPNTSRPKGVRGLDALADVARRLDRRAPLVAIGGITEARLPGVVRAGADAWAVIGAVAASADPVAATRRLLHP